MVEMIKSTEWMIDGKECGKFSCHKKVKIQL